MLDRKQLDILAIGDVCIDMYMKLGSGSVTEDTSQKERKLCFYHGNKILVDKVDQFPGGNALNFVVGVSKLGVASGIYTEIGDDVSADRIIDELKYQGVDTSLVRRNKNLKTAIHPVLVFDAERTIFTHHEKRTYKIPMWPKANWIYYTSVSEGFEEFQEALINQIAKSSSALVFNPGSVHMKKGMQSFENVLKVTDVLIVNDTEAEILVGKDEKLKMHMALTKLGPKISVITYGKSGASAYDGGTYFEQPAFEIYKPIVDKTGAGDAFSAGFVAALIYKKGLKEALLWGAINSSAEIREVGSTIGQLTRKELESYLKSI